jgi:hypothetical protein
MLKRDRMSGLQWYSFDAEFHKYWLVSVCNMLRMFENKVLRIIFGGPKRKEVAGGRKVPHNEELRSLSASLNVIRVMKSRMMVWAGHVSRL